MSSFQRSVCVLLAVCFGYMVVLQFNDPDRLVWSVIYAGVALACALGATGRLWPVPTGVACVLYAIGAVYWWPGTFEGFTQSMSEYRPEIEEAREAGGLFLGAVALAILVLFGGRDSGGDESQ